jgi:hypothetical protein
LRIPSGIDGLRKADDLVTGSFVGFFIPFARELKYKKMSPAG